MQVKYLPAGIMLTAGATTILINIINKIELVLSLKRLLIILIIFYIIGLIARAIIEKVTAFHPIVIEEVLEGDKEETPGDKLEEKSIEVI